MMRYFPLVLFAGLAVLLLIALGHEKTPENRWVGKPLPALSATALGAEDVSSVAMGDGMTLINLFASWCTPCLAEHPELKRLADTGKVTLIGIAWNDTPEAITTFLEKHGDPYDRVYIDHKGDAAMPLGIRGIPESFLVDAQGRILYHIAGPIDAERVTRDIMPLVGE